MTNKEVLENFKGTKCVCGKSKTAKMSHCSTCYHKLPNNMKWGLYRKFGKGYEKAFTESVKFLEASWVDMEESL